MISLPAGFSNLNVENSACGDMVFALMGLYRA